MINFHWRSLEALDPALCDQEPIRNKQAVRIMVAAH
jgi:hypothetical protein